LTEEKKWNDGRFGEKIEPVFWGRCLTRKDSVFGARERSSHLKKSEEAPRGEEGKEEGSLGKPRSGDIFRLTRLELGRPQKLFAEKREGRID